MLHDGIVDLVPGLESYPTKLLAIQAMQFDVDGVVLPTSQQTDPMHLVNGQWQPVIRIAPGEIQRWQIANITAGNVYQIALETMCCCRSRRMPIPSTHRRISRNFCSDQESGPMCWCRAARRRGPTSSGI